MIRAEMMARMSASEFSEWMVFDEIEPFGDRRLDLVCGILGSLLANLHGRGPTDPPFSPEQFMPNFDPKEPEVQDANETAQMLDLFFSNV